jgi:hypothetical protein
VSILQDPGLFPESLLYVYCRSVALQLCDNNFALVQRLLVVCLFDTAGMTPHTKAAQVAVDLVGAFAIWKAQSDYFQHYGLPNFEDVYSIG